MMRIALAIRHHAASSGRAVVALALVVAFLATTAAASAEVFWKAGVAATNITPIEPLFLAGYAIRDQPVQGKVMDLWLKALALEDAGGHRALIVTCDLLGIPQAMYRSIASALKAQFGLEPDRFMLLSSHTHCGPVLQGALYDMYPMTDDQRALIERYSAKLEASLIGAAARALSSLSPARLAASQGSTGFAVNRRNNVEENVPKLLAQGALKGPVDHAVPVLAISTPDGQLKAVVFGYACHNTVMSFSQWSGDYAGFAQIALEKSHPGATAMFFMGCGGDQNPLPRRRLDLAERYGNMLAAAVEETLLTPLRPLAPELRSSMEMVSLDFGTAPTREELEKLKADKSETARRWSARLLAQLNEGKPFVRSYSFPVQAWLLGGSQLWITLGGEPVVDYALALKPQFGQQTWVAGYCNDVMTYIPSLRVLKEGGYEGGGAMMPYGQPAFRWADDVEERITNSVRRVAGRARAGGNQH